MSVLVPNLPEIAVQGLFYGVRGGFNLYIAWDCIRHWQTQLKTIRRGDFLSLAMDFRTLHRGALRPSGRA